MFLTVYSPVQIVQYRTNEIIDSAVVVQVQMRERCGGVCPARSRQVLTQPLNPERHLFETSHHRRRPAATCSGQSGRSAALTCVQVLSCDRYLTGISRDSFVTACSRSLL